MLHLFARDSHDAPSLKQASRKSALLPVLFSAVVVGGSVLSPLSGPDAWADELQVQGSQAADPGITQPIPSETPFTLSIQPSAAPAPKPAQAVPSAESQSVATARDARVQPPVARITSVTDSHPSGVVVTPWKKPAALQTAQPQSPMTYHGGPVERASSVNFTIFWRPAGTFMSASYQPLLNRYFQDVGGSPLYGLLTQYSDTGGQIANNSSLGGTWVDTAPYPSNFLSDADLQNSVLRALNANKWSILGVNANFVVYTAFGEESCASPGVCSSNVFCGYHSNFPATDGVNNFDIKYSNIPYGGNHPGPCGTTTSPNGDFAADSAINISSHEHMETVTDPDANAWFDTNLAGEIGDKCAFVFGPTNGQGANVSLNGHPYIVQQEWSNAAGNCALSLQLPSFSLSVGLAGSGSGTVTSNPLGISCPATCFGSFLSGTPVVLTATPNSGSVFAGWSGACTGLGVCTVAMDAAHAVTANFAGSAACSPRPNVHVAASPSTPGVLQVTVSASGANVVLQSIQFGTPVNGLITGGGLVDSSGNVALPLSSMPKSFTFTIRRVMAGASVTVPFVVTDSCGAWPTFVGGGPTAF